MKKTFVALLLISSFAIKADYKDSCSDCTVSEQIFNSSQTVNCDSCKKNDGSLISSSVTCLPGADINNCDGQLKCTDCNITNKKPKNNSSGGYIEAAGDLAQGAIDMAPDF